MLVYVIFYLYSTYYALDEYAAAAKPYLAVPTADTSLATTPELLTKLDIDVRILGSDYVGIDISEKYVKKIQDRIDKFETERSILDEEKKLHELSGKTYAERMRAKQIKENDFWEVK